MNNKKKTILTLNRNDIIPSPRVNNNEFNNNFNYNSNNSGDSDNDKIEWEQHVVKIDWKYIHIQYHS